MPQDELFALVAMYARIQASPVGSIYGEPKRIAKDAHELAKELIRLVREARK